jgi:hypothetical protein
MKPLPVALLLLSAVPCAARVEPATNTSTDAGCPLTLIDASFEHSKDSTVQFDLYAYYKNQTDKVMIGESFAFDVMDSVGDWTTYPHSLAASSKLKTCNKSYTIWNAYPGSVGGFRVYVKKIAYSDGTTWEDDGSKKCMYSRDLRQR